MYKIPTKFFNFIWFFIVQQKFGFSVIMITSLGSAISIAVWPYIIANLIDSLESISVSLETKNIFQTPIAYAVYFWMLIEILNRLKGFSLSLIMPKFQASIRLKAFNYVNQHSHSYFVSNYVGGIANRIADLPRGAQMVVDISITMFLPIMFAILISSVLFFTVNPYLSIILIIWLSIHLFILFKLSQNAAKLSKDQSESRTMLQAKIVDSISNHLNVRLFTSYSHEEEKLVEIQEDEKSKFKISLQYVEKIKLILSLIGVFWISFLFVITFKLWNQDLISIGMVVLVINTVLNLMTQLGVAAEEMTYLFREIGVCQQALKIFQDPIVIKDLTNANQLKVVSGNVKFENVTFRYRHGNNILYNQNLSIEGGQKVGLVGFSGSGKTTFASLLLKLYEINEGKILIDDQDISQVTSESLRKSISFIPQEPILFHRSILENIRYGNINSTDDEVIAAAIQANCHEFILTLEDGYNTTVGERGIKLSGGQRQRIAIARAILKDASIIIMDEATSALDSVTEKIIKDSINHLTKERTTIIIAHRLSTLLDVNRILVFHNGQIVEDGKHSELIINNGHYAELWKMQNDGLLPSNPSTYTNVG